MFLIVDHHDSFTYNLAQLFGAEGVEVGVTSADVAAFACARETPCDAVILGPGPGDPRDRPDTTALAQALLGRVPLLGVCLGHQILCTAMGARVELAREPVHGQACAIVHTGVGLFEGMPQPWPVARYHSWVVRRWSLPACLRIAAWDEDEQVMAVQDTARAAYGVQFHPESFLTHAGRQLAQRFIERVRAYPRSPLRKVAHG